jgi:hypothetical protein
MTLLARLQSAESPDGREPYQPANGIEGADFMADWCDRCQHDAAFREGTGESCAIADNAMAYDEDDPEYPVEWREDGPEGPRCTAFTAVLSAMEKNDV